MLTVCPRGPSPTALAFNLLSSDPAELVSDSNARTLDRALVESAVRTAYARNKFSNYREGQRVGKSDFFEPCYREVIFCFKCTTQK